MKWSLDRKIHFGFALALSFLVVIGIVSYRTTMQLLDTVHHQLTAHRMLAELDDIRSQLQDAETGQRGFLLTNEERYLDPYQKAIGLIREEIQALRQLTASNPRRRSQLDTLESLVEKKFAELGETIELRRNRGLEPALAIVRTDRGKQVMDDLRRLIGSIEVEEIESLQQLDQQAERKARHTTVIIFTGILLAFVLVALATLIIHRDITEHRRAQEALQRAHDELEVRVRERTSELVRANEELQREIAERKQAEAKLAVTLEQVEQSHDEMLSILNQLRLGTVATDASGRISFVSRVAQRMFVKSQEQARGMHWEELFAFPEAEKQQLRQMCQHPTQLRAKLPVHFEAPSGRYWMEVEVQDDPRETQRKIFLFYDMSEVYDLRRLLSEKAQFNDLIGKSAPMGLVYQQIHNLAHVETTLLIDGETGTGKELVAHAIHSTGPRKHKPFIAVNCAGLTDSLLASQLFGHKRGAFTGAVDDQKGLFEAADGGTIFLDEIGDVSPGVQTSLLRVLQEKEIVRLGESTPHKIDVRIIAATQHDLTEEMTKERFRADLLYRIRVARIHLATLRDRREDIPLLVAWFLGQCRATTGKTVEMVSEEAMRFLLDYSWPGNVRELKSAIEFAVIHSQGSVVQSEDLPEEITTSRAPQLATLSEEQPERQRILAALERAKGNRTLASAMLGISRATLYRRLAELHPPEEK